MNSFCSSDWECLVKIRSEKWRRRRITKIFKNCFDIEGKIFLQFTTLTEDADMAMVSESMSLEWNDKTIRIRRAKIRKPKKRVHLVSKNQDRNMSWESVACKDYLGYAYYLIDLIIHILDDKTLDLNIFGLCTRWYSIEFET